MPLPLSLRLATALVSLTAPPAQASAVDDTASVDHLIAAYHQAVLDHDGLRLSSLFMPDGTAWFSVLTNAGLARVRARKPDAARLRPGSVKDFVAMVATSKAKLDPEHDHLRVRSDGAVATVTFDFRFFIDGKEQNRGSESWQLLKGDDGWRIASIIYSSAPPA